MDPALRELVRSDADGDAGEVEAIISLDDPHVDVVGVRIVARFGHVATCRIEPDRILPTWHDGNVVSLKRPRPLGPEPAWNRMGDLPIEVADGDERRPPHVGLTGAGVVVGVVDWGCDFDHPNLKHPDGSTRLLGLWDQRTPPNGRSPRPYGYGTFHDRERINAALRRAEPYDALSYHPATADRDGRGAHGTHVIDIAAGNGHGGGPAGIAPGAELVFVHLAESETRGLANLGDSARILEAVHLIARVAGRRPWVINLSVGRCGGPHDGSTLAEQALDFVVQEAPGRFVVQSAGNYFDRSTHAGGRIAPGGARTLTFVTDPADVTPNELEVWYPGGDALSVEIESPHGARTPWVALGGQHGVVEDGAVVGRLYHRRRDPNNGDNHVDLFLSPSASAGPWNVTLRAVRVRSGVFHAWLERDEACRPCQARFVPDDVDPRATTGTIANGRQPFVVGAYDAHSRERRVAPFSSAGPTRDGRPKPDCVAPGVQVLAARSAPLGSRRSPGLVTRKSGTSMAAPHVTGAVALYLEAAENPPTGTEICNLLRSALQPPPSHPRGATRMGGGYFDLRRLLALLTPPKDHEMQPNTIVPASLAQPETIFRQIACRPNDPLPASIDHAFAVVARPGEAPRVAPQRGDVLVRVALGEPGPGHVAVLASGDLTPWHALGTASLRGEGEGAGSYAPVVEGGPVPHGEGDRFVRRVLDRHGRMPLGQLLLRPRLSEAITSPSPEAETNTEQTADTLTAPLTSREWELVENWQSAGRVDGEPLTSDSALNELIVASAIFCGRRPYSEPDDDPLFCIDPGVTSTDPRVVALTPHVASRGEIVNWASVPLSRRRVLVMELLIDEYGYPVNGAAGLVGNLNEESAVLPNRIEGSRPATPMRARNFRGMVTDFTATEAMNRDDVRRRGPRLEGVGLAQWTYPPRRAGLFRHRHGTRPAGAGILFDLPAQVDYLVTELRADYPRLEATLSDPAVTVDDASDAVLYDFERPEAIIVAGVVLPRAHPAVEAAFRARRPAARTALADYRAAHPPAPSAESLTTPTASPVELFEQVPPQRCGFFPTVDTEVLLRAAVRDIARNERRRWFDASGTAFLQESDAGQFGHLVRYWLATISGMRSSTLTHAEAVAIGTINYQPLRTAAGGAAINAAAAAIQAQLLAGAPGAGNPVNLGTLVDQRLRLARRSHDDHEAWSAAFVSYCIRRVAINLGLETDATGTHEGRNVLLQVSRRHRDYIRVAAVRGTAGPTQRLGTYHAFEPRTRAVQVGDIIVQDRHAGNVANVWPSNDIINLPLRRLHCDIVTEVVGGDHVVAIGGNVGESVRRRRYPLDAASMLVVERDQLYTQENNAAFLPAVPAVNAAPAFHTRSTARIFALLSPVEHCVSP